MLSLAWGGIDVAMSEKFDLSELFGDPARVAGIPISHIPALITRLSSLQTAIAARLIVGEERILPEDNLLRIDEAAKRLGVSPDWLYRRTSKLPFVVRLGRHVRFSAQGIENYVKRRA